MLALEIGVIRAEMVANDSLAGAASWAAAVQCYLFGEADAIAAVAWAPSR
jgi:hypothetical protein